MPGEKQPCPTVAACWSPAMPRMRIGAPNNSGVVCAELGGAVAHGRQQALRHAEHAAKTFIPLAKADIEHQRTRGIGGIGGVHLAAGQPPQQKTIDRSEGELARLRGGARAFDLIEQPSDLAGGKIRVEQQPGFGGNLRLKAIASPRIAKFRGAPVLPDDGIVNGFAGDAVPQHRGFALIGNADSGDISRGQPGLGHRVAHGGDDGPPDFFRVVLDPARRRENLAQLQLGCRERLEAGVEHDGARRRRALVDGDECGRQEASPGPYAPKAWALIPRSLIEKDQSGNGLVAVFIDGGGQIARQWAIIGAGLDDGAWLGQHRHHAAMQRFGRNRLEQEFVDADLDGFDHARALHMLNEVRSSRSKRFETKHCEA